MQTVTSTYSANADRRIRKIAFKFMAAFNKQYDAGIDFFTIGSSAVGGTDVIRPSDTDVIKEWDKYVYTDYSDRVISIEWTQEEQPISSVSMAYGTVVLDNKDDFFTQGSGSLVDGNVKPYRPVRLFAGFDGEVIQTFVGLTEDSGKVDEEQKTVTFRVVDFLQSIFNRALDEEIILQNKRTDEILSTLLQSVGLSTGQFDLDTGFNIVKFAYFEKRSKLGTAISQLMEAEMGRFYMDELGLIRFKNRQNYSDSITEEFSKNNIYSMYRREEEQIKNVIELTGEVREVQSLQPVGTLGTPVLIKAGQTADVWIEFLDPVTSVVAPQETDTATSSYYIISNNQDGSGLDVYNEVNVDSTSLFSTAYKITFDNTDTKDYWIVNVSLFGTPAKVIENILVKEEDATSISQFDERVLDIDNKFFQDEDQTRSKALMLLDDYKEYAPIERIEVHAKPQLQIGDAIKIHNDGITREYVITRINCIIKEFRLRQILDVKVFNRRNYFTIGSSAIGGTDQIAP